MTCGHFKEPNNRRHFDAIINYIHRYIILIRELLFLSLQYILQTLKIELNAKKSLGL